MAIFADGLSNWSTPSRHLWPFGHRTEADKPRPDTIFIMQKQIFREILPTFLQENYHAVCLLLAISPILRKLHGEQ
jgi:hypothetical protein